MTAVVQAVGVAQRSGELGMGEDSGFIWAGIELQVRCEHKLRSVRSTFTPRSALSAVFPSRCRVAVAIC